MPRHSIILLTLCALICGACTHNAGTIKAEYDGGTMYVDHGVKVVCLYGDWEQMGRQWGALGRESMQNVLDFINEKTESDTARVESYRQMAEKLYSHYPAYLRTFFEAAAETSGMSLDQLKAVNALEWGERSFMCSGIACWGDYSDGPLVYGRNYDAYSYGELGDEVVVTVFHPSDGTQDFAIVGYAGEIYCVNGFNESGLFVELNNGMASSGYDINFDISISTTELMRLIAEARTLDDADEFFATTESASGFIIGVSDGESARSYEWFGDKAYRSEGGTAEGLMVLNNHFTSPEWDLPDPAEANCWDSHARRANLIAFAEANKGQIDADMLKGLMRVLIADGGPAIEGYERYQMVAVPSEFTFFLNIPDAGISWAEIDLEKYF